MCCEGRTRRQAGDPGADGCHCGGKRPPLGVPLLGLLLISLLAGLASGVGVLLFSGSWLGALIAYIGIGNLALAVGAYAAASRTRRAGGVEKCWQ